MCEGDTELQELRTLLRVTCDIADGYDLAPFERWRIERVRKVAGLSAYREPTEEEITELLAHTKGE